jgi:hypothetical protein
MEIKIYTGQGVACQNTSGCTYLGPLGRATISIIIGAIKKKFFVHTLYPQYLTNLVSAGVDNTSSIVANMIPVASWYHHHMVLTVVCQSGIIIVWVLALLKKLLYFALYVYYW